MTAHHPTLAAGRWRAMSLAEQLGNVGSEVFRAIRWRDKEPSSFQQACARALELIDLTIADPRWRTRRELTRIREVVCDFLIGGNTYRTEATSLQQYFDQFAVLARNQRPRYKR